MDPLFVFDSYKTLVECPEWEQRKESDPLLKHLEQEWIAAGRPWPHAYLDEGDKAIENGTIKAVAYPDTRHVLETLAARGTLGIFSSNSRASLLAILMQTGLGRFFTSIRTIVSASKLGGLSKTSPEAYRALQEAYAKLEYEMRTFTDDDLKVVQAVVASGVPIPGGIYHLDRKSGLSVPRQDKGFMTISSLDQMLELH